MLKTLQCNNLYIESNFTQIMTKNIAELTIEKDTLRKILRDNLQMSLQEVKNNLRVALSPTDEAFGNNLDDSSRNFRFLSTWYSKDYEIEFSDLQAEYKELLPKINEYLSKH